MDKETLEENLGRVQDQLAYETRLVSQLLDYLTRYGAHRPGCKRLLGTVRSRCTCGWLDASVDILRFAAEHGRDASQSQSRL